ncbi:hypothetical protein PGT21_015009 [Puccinia graminis f. sp. tritici]|uniref:DNA primase large subunit n=1 Tax=Puccinia graminis f. sp. tritici TaxID=56615 RepID=A0A5B0Q2P9_PUCGR|nr:hypothetical protein PGT21_015009 [Puccinia graminis f. sp. tritici]KAA1124718.1 hypothetical protein PGTUg99_032593 [Puccinia graminis f. sp. tritici]
MFARKDLQTIPPVHQRTSTPTNRKILKHEGPLTTNHDPNPLKLKYPHRLNFYDKPPDSEVTIEEFETWAIDRLKVLAEIENSASRNKSFDELKTTLNVKSKEFLPLNAKTAQSVNLDQERKKDHYSHFILRLAFCRSEELRNRFVNAETQLFRYRLETDDTSERADFVGSLNLDWKEASPEETMEARRAFIKDKKHFGEEGSYYKVRWLKVPDLVAARRVYLSSGYAFVASKDQSSIIIQEFSSKLLQALEITSKHLPYMDEDSRLLPVLEHLSISFLAGISGSDFVSTSLNPDGGELTASMIDDLAKQHFPPCMKNLWILLRKDKHLKYGGRQQLNLFLKGIGLPIEEAVIFWRQAFSNISDDKFRKDYRYAVRHNYGLEGSRTNYQPKSCVTIITGSVGPLESHGCPFKHFSQLNLTQHLNQLYQIDLKSDLMKDIIEFKKNDHYHLACTAVWEHQHKALGVKKGDGLGQGESVSHPNRYYEASYKLKTASNPTEPST